jgi:hypothetical protein
MDARSSRGRLPHSSHRPLGFGSRAAFVCHRTGRTELRGSNNLVVWTIPKPQTPARRAGFAELLIDLFVIDHHLGRSLGVANPSRIAPGIANGAGLFLALTQRSCVLRHRQKLLL